MGVSIACRLNNKHILISLIFIIIFFPTSSWATCPLSTTHSFLRPRSFSQNMPLEYSLFNYYLYHLYRSDEQVPFFNFQTMLFYYTSTNKGSLRNFFFPNDQQQLRVELNNVSDISATQIGIVREKNDTFASAITIAPRRRVAGGAFGFFFNLDSYISNTWFNIFFPLIFVKHDLNFVELQFAGDGFVSGVPNVQAALNNPAWQFGKFSPDPITEVGIDDILVRFGWDWIKDPYGYKHISLYGLLNFPTGHKSDPEFIFEPTMGSGGHVGIGFGINADYWWWNYALSQFAFFGDFRFTYYFKNEETRSFDLFNGPLTRYLQVATVQKPINAMPGINDFTQCVDVVPGNMMEFLIGLHYSYANVHVEFGYDLWWRQRENVTLKGDPLRNKVIFDIVGAVCNTPTSSSNTTISQGTPGFQAPISDPVIVPLKNKNFNLDAGTQPVSMSSTMFLSFGLDWYVGRMPNFFGLSFYYEFSHNRATIEQAGGSLKYGFRY